MLWAMEIRDPIHGNIPVTRAELRIIDHPLFQRLRNIRQLGFAHLAFPGATHTRFPHCLGTMHLATQAFDTIFPPGGSPAGGARERFRVAVRLAALLHDVGHLPLSHSSEFAMPSVGELGVACYRGLADPLRRGTHEDMSVLLTTQSSLAPLVAGPSDEVTPVHVAALLSRDVPVDDGFFEEAGLDFRPVLSQIVSSEIDADRMDYLLRDSHFAGVEYGRFDKAWLLSSLTHHVVDDRVHLAIHERSRYTFDHFLLARYHMFLMLYYHHRSVIFDEMLRRYFESGEYRLPTDPEEYASVDDVQLVSALRASSDPWARRIVGNEPLRKLIELHGDGARERVGVYERALNGAGVATISSTAAGVISKYVGGMTEGGAPSIYMIGRPGPGGPLEVRDLSDATQLFTRYKDARHITRLYVDDMAEARRLLAERFGWSGSDGRSG